MKTLMKGNEALAESAIRAGCKCYFGYPITPQNEIGAYMSAQLPKRGGTFLQAESEIAAINMVYGCAATGTRCMTSSSSPGISLKTEGISYIAGADLPCVIINVQRGGPGLGSIQPSQADYWQTTRALGHGDLRLPVLAPASVQEMVDMMQEAFDLAEKYRTPVIILADGVLGQMMEPVDFDSDTSSAEGGTRADVVGWATVGHEGKRKYNVVNSLYLEPVELEEKVRERFERYEVIKSNHTRGVAEDTDGADIVAVAYGSTARIVKSAVKIVSEETGAKIGLFRPQTLFPFPEQELVKACESAKKVLVAEMSMGQMIDDVKAALQYNKQVEFFGRTGGFIPSPQEIAAALRRILNDV